MDQPYRVVLIDDDPDLRKLVKLTLEFTAGWQVTTAANGQEGIEAVRAAPPDVAVVDIMMPDMDGYEVCRRLREEAKTADVPVVFLTARKQLDEARMKACGAQGVVVKPFEPESLADELRRLCGGEES
jgi:CheY-like chemotaxis protein